MPPGYFGIQEGTGYLWYRTIESGICINNHRGSYSGSSAVNGRNAASVRLRILPPGTKIEIIV